MLTSPGGDPVSPSSPPGSNYLRDTVWTLSRPAVSITHGPAHIKCIYRPVRALCNACRVQPRCSGHRGTVGLDEGEPGVPYGAGAIMPAESLHALDDGGGRPAPLALDRCPLSGVAMGPLVLV